ncbi:MAG: phosphonate metabolism protein/1,5-bisphosphokinase (PRPP-forming) PhnN [Sideroxyarcus sp.]|nr:phosphonate metabolism protein/1,5-bisphosphokinase (PRPP-forming) PhnN [Sideroxyarcus sp.]
MTGRLVLVVGPSGVGKDSLLRYAMAHFAGDARFVFPKRCVTRAVDVAAEDHDSLDERTFDELAGKGAFALMWEAHGHKYGVRNDIHAELQRGCIVAVNVSRTIIAEVAGRYQNAVVIEITADPSVRVARLAARGREADDDILQRTRREVVTPAHALPLYVIRNDGNISSAGVEFCRSLAGLIEI